MKSGMARSIWRAGALALFSLWVLVGNIGVARADVVAHLKRRIEHLLVAERLPYADVGIFARVTDSGRILFARNADTPFMPASNFKILTTSTALAVLGPNFRYTTEIFGPPVDASGVIHGNLYLRGTGDPTMVEPWTEPATGPFEHFADALSKCGVRQITGALVGDDIAFDRTFIGRGWLQRYSMCDYAAETSALSINGNVMYLDVRPNHVDAYPSSTALRIRRVFSGRGGCVVTRAMNHSTVLVQNLSPGHSVQASLTFHNPSLYTTGVFARILAEHGIKTGRPMRLIGRGDLPLPKGMRCYAQHHSCRLIKILRQINKHSDNFFADHVFKTLGWREFGQGTWKTGTRAVMNFLHHLGVDTHGMQLADGCGLSVLNHVTPRQFVQVLEAMSKRPEGRLLKWTLPIAGVDGTLAGRLHGLPVVAKTGTIDGTCTLSGYLITHAGQQVCFSILVNHSRRSNDEIRWLQDQIVRSMVSLSERV